MLWMYCTFQIESVPDQLFLLHNLLCNLLFADQVLFDKKLIPWNYFD